MIPQRPQDWITTALRGFFADEGLEMPAGMKGALIAQLALACVGIQGEVEIEPFESIVRGGNAP